MSALTGKDRVDYDTEQAELERLVKQINGRR